MANVDAVPRYGWHGHLPAFLFHHAHERLIRPAASPLPSVPVLPDTAAARAAEAPTSNEEIRCDDVSSRWAPPRRCW